MLRLLATALLATLPALVAAPNAAAGEVDSAARGRREGTAVRPATTASMVRLPAGSYRPLYGQPNDRATPVAAFWLDRDPVTRGDFLAFVRANPQWRRSAVRPLLADREGYLAEWKDDVDPGDARDLRRPVTGVSWFAAKAYCAARGKRLPTVAEWEYAAAASETRRDGAGDADFVQRLVSLYATRAHPLPPVEAGGRNVYGVRGLHGLAWEWTADFNSTLASEDSHRGGHDHGHDMFCASAAIGSADPSNYPAFLRYAMRAGLTGRTTLETLGFRCAA